MYISFVIEIREFSVRPIDVFVCFPLTFISMIAVLNVYSGYFWQKQSRESSEAIAEVEERSFGVKRFLGCDQSGISTEKKRKASL